MFTKYAKSFLSREVSDERENDTLDGLDNPFESAEPAAPAGPTYYNRTDFQNERPETIIGSSVTIEGVISFENLLQIDGSFTGQLLSNGKLIVGESGYVKADITLSEAIISGRVEGNIEVTGRLVLQGSAHVTGNIKAASITVDEGAVINGMVQIVKPSAEPVEA